MFSWATTWACSVNKMHLDHCSPRAYLVHLLEFRLELRDVH